MSPKNQNLNEYLNKQKRKRRQKMDAPIEINYLLNKGQFGYIGSVDAENIPHVTPVIFVYHKNKIFFATSEESKKVKNISQNEKVSFLIDIRDPTHISRNIAVQVLGKAKVYGWKKILKHPLQIIKVIRKFQKKYPHYMKIYEEEKEKIPEAWRASLWCRKIIVVKPDTINYWQTSERWREQLNQKYGSEKQKNKET